MSLFSRKKMTIDEYSASEEKHRAVWWVGRVIALILVFGTIAILLWRIFTSGDPSELKVIQVDQALADAYAAAAAEGRELEPYYNDELYTITYEKERYGYFSVSQVRIIEEAEQVQLVFRYNNSTIRHLKEDYALAEMPSRSDELYDITLYVAYDLTPEDDTDNDGNDPASVRFVRYQPTSVTAKQKGLYNYRALMFNDVDMTNSETPVLAVYVDVYYKGDVHYLEDEGGQEPYSALMIYDYVADRTPRALTKKDKEAIEAWGK